MYSLFLHFPSFIPLFYLVLGPDNDDDDKNKDGDKKGDDTDDDWVNPQKRSKERNRKLTEKRRRRRRQGRCTPKIGEHYSSIKVLVYSKDTLLWMGGLYVVAFFFFITSLV